MKKYLCSIFFLIMIYIPCSGFGAFMFHPELDWKSIKTEHFWIHYHQGLEEHARRLVPVAEDLHTRLVRATGWEPFWRTDVVLVDNTDMPNGFTIPVPYNRVQLYIVRPGPDSSLGDYDDWVKLVFTHEYSHVFNLDVIDGIPQMSRYTLGRVCFPNMFLPMWNLEGYPVYRESMKYPYGRVHSAYTHMVMRTEVDENSLKSINLASYFPREWPSGMVPYLYGGLFVEYLQQTQGHSRFEDVFTENADNILPWLIQKNGRDVYGRSFYALWDQWQNEAVKRYRREAAQIREKGLTDARLLTHSGYHTSIPRFSTDGKVLYYVRMTGYNMPALMRVSLRDGTTKKIARVRMPSGMSVNDTHGILMSDLEYYRTFSIYNDIFRYQDGYRQQTRGMRAQSVDAFPDGKIACIQVKDDRYNLLILDERYNSQNVLINKSRMQLSGVRVSPGGKNLVFTARGEDGFAHIYHYGVDNGKIQKLTSGRYSCMHPDWYPGGGAIVFVSDRDGVFNLYSLELKSRQLKKLTNMMGGAFWPDISPDGSSIAAAVYGKEGFDIGLIEHPEDPPVIEKVQVTYAEELFADAPPIDGEKETGKEAGGYNPLYSLVNPAWLPVLYSEEIYPEEYDSWYGFYTMGADTLYRHFYSVYAAASVRQKRADVSLQYTYAGLYPDITIAFSDNSIFYGTDPFPWEDDHSVTLKRELERTIEGGISIPFMKFYNQHLLSLSYSREVKWTDIYYSGMGVFEFEDVLAGFHGGYSFSSTSMYAYSVSPEDGVEFMIIGDWYTNRVGSDINYGKVRGELAWYLSGIWRNNVIMLRGRGGASFNNPDYLDPYNIGRYEKGNTGAAQTGEDRFGMRGYGADMFYGNRLAVGALEYRLPLLQKDLGYGTLPVMLRDIWLVPFVEYGNVWKDHTGLADFRTSVGGELHMRLTMGYGYDISGFAGVAHGFDEYGETQVYFGVAGMYEGAGGNNKPYGLMR
ncbi:MAG: DPP IV N-terminal domain-containing protein [Spirochaetota bacterium]